MQRFPGTAETVGVDQDVGTAVVTERYPYLQEIIINKTASLQSCFVDPAKANGCNTVWGRV